MPNLICGKTAVGGNYNSTRYIYRSKPNVYYQKIMTEYRDNDDTLFIICEGNEDTIYYGHTIKKLYPDYPIRKMCVECRNNVLTIHNLLERDFYNKKRILFFIDRDFSFWISEKQELDTNIYITEQYSIENDAVNIDTFIETLQDLYGFVNATKCEIDSMKIKYQELWGNFVAQSYFIMGAVVVSYIHNKEHYAKKIEISKLIKIKPDSADVWVKNIKGQNVEDYILEKLVLLRDDVEEIKKYQLRFERETQHYSVRGKWALAFMVKMMEYIMNNGSLYASSLYKDEIKKPKRLCQITVDNAMAILATRINPPESLVRFINSNVGNGL